MKYYYTDGSAKCGPFSKKELLDLKLDINTRVWRLGLAGWVRIADLEELAELLPGNQDLSFEYTLKNQRKRNARLQSSNSLKKPRNTKLVLLALVLSIFFLMVVGLMKNRKRVSEGKLRSKLAESSWSGGEDFNLYVDKFFRDVNAMGIYPLKPDSIIIRFAPLSKFMESTHLHGISFGYKNDDIIEIYINPDSWAKFKRPMKYLLIYHELAHDVLNLDDLEVIDENFGRLMYPEISGYEFSHMDDFISCYKSEFDLLTLNAE